MGGDAENSTVSAPMNPAGTWHGAGRFVCLSNRHKTIREPGSLVSLALQGLSLSVSLSHADKAGPV